MDVDGENLLAHTCERFLGIWSKPEVRNRLHSRATLKLYLAAMILSLVLVCMNEHATLTSFRNSAKRRQRIASDL